MLFKTNDTFILAPASYDRFASFLSDINQYELTRKRQYKYEYSFITFNYDVALDMALGQNNLNPHYCLENDSTTNGSPLLKLHGSLNWSKCSKCGSIKSLKINELGLSVLRGEREVYFNIADFLGKKQCCDTKLSGPPIIVPPTWNKSEHHQALSVVWEKAAKELSEAENIFIIGYSMPESDYFFKFLLALGINSRTRISRFWVFNPDKSLEQRFRNMISRGIERSFQYYPVPFSNAITILNQELK